jgi:hypothetical protein
MVRVDMGIDGLCRLACLAAFGMGKTDGIDG